MISVPLSVKLLVCENVSVGMIRSVGHGLARSRLRLRKAAFCSTSVFSTRRKAPDGCEKFLICAFFCLVIEWSSLFVCHECDVCNLCVNVVQ